MNSYRDRAKDLLDRYMDEALIKRTHIGLTFGLLEQGRASFWNYGFSNLNGQKPIHENTFFEIASNTKVFTALLFAQLIRKGLCSPEDPIQKFLPEIPSSVRINLLQLLTHRSGLSREPSNFESIAPQNSFLPYNNQKLKEALKNLKQPREQGNFLYSSFGYLILGRIAEKIANTSNFSKILLESIITPLGLSDTRFHLTSFDLERFCPGHGEKFESISYLDLGEVYNAAGGLKSTIFDLCKFMGWFLNPESAPRDFSQDFIRLMEVTSPSDTPEVSFGFHLLDLGKQLGYFHQGSLAGCKSTIFFSPELQRGLAYYSNTPSHIPIRRQILLS